MMKKICAILPLLLLMACSPKTVYFEYHSFPLEGWEADSIVSFCFSVPDATKTYDAIISVRHTERYPYQNMWLFVQNENLSDTIEFYLADNRGRWLGNGFGDKREMPVLYLQKQHFGLTDTICISIRQGMREQLLRGVSEIGLKIVESEQ